MPYTVPHYINGQPINTPATKQSLIHNPALGNIIGHIHIANKTTCDEAVAAAKTASLSWANTPPVKRAQVLFKFRELLEINQLDLAHIVTREQGKALDDAKGSVARAIEAVEFYCGLVTQLQGEYSTNVSHHLDCYTLRQPLGVCAGVSPFNFPIMVPIWMMIPAIAYGNAFILKPSEQDPSAPVRLMELLSDAGLPAGVVNCIQGDKSTVDYLLDNSDISAFTAVASTAVAKSIYTKAITRGMRAHTFGGAKNHAVIMPDADMDKTAIALVGAAYGSAGERCMAISVVVAVGDGTADKLLSKLIPSIQAIKIDNGATPGCEMGPLVSLNHKQRVIEAINNGITEGATLMIDGRDFCHPDYPDGYFLGPSLFDNVTESMSVYQQEIFGPVLVIMRVSCFEDALALVNRHDYGNGTAIFTRDAYTAREYSQQVNVGMVGVNIPIPVPITSHPFGGWKNSVFGDSFMHGRESLHFYTKLKTITSKWIETDISSNSFNMPTHR